MTEREQEDLLRESLRRVQPPDGFADRVMARLPRQPWWSRFWRLRAARMDSGRCDAAGGFFGCEFVGVRAVARPPAAG